MDQSKMQALLQRIHAELRSADSGDPGTRAMVDKVSAHLAPVVEGVPGKTPSGGYATLAERLKEAAVHFETSHPELARSIEGAIDALGSYGI